MRIKEYTKASSLNKTDAFVVETENGTRYVEQQNLLTGHIIPVTSGGTGASKAEDARTNLGVFRNLGSNITGGEDNDTAQFWQEHEPGVYYFSKTGQLKDQPSGYGYLLNIKSSATGGLSTQIFCSFGSGQLYVRGTNYNSSNNVLNNWIKMTQWTDIYPVGAVYISYSSTSPASLFGGSWTPITGKFIRAASDVSTGGSDSTTLTTSHLPSHTHTFVGGRSGALDSNAGYGLTAAAAYKNNVVVYADGNHKSGYIDSTGSGSSVTNMPSYQDLYVWRRTA